ncbi:hypothetical protein [Bacillus sp. FJAT-29790]|nr:hypothetical protein [Bacillus sp. FJAT-29790]
MYKAILFLFFFVVLFTAVIFSNLRDSFYNMF